MNDEMEGKELFEALKKISEKNLGSSERNLFNILVATLTRWQFAFCASRLEDDISQWRAYTELGQGICIEFDSTFIEEPYIDKFECVYNRLEKEALIKQLDLHITGDELSDSVGNPEGAHDYIDRFSKALASLKHSSFAPESEVRWVNSKSGLSDTPPEVEFRTHRLGLVPYSSVPVNISGVKKLWLGPKVQVDKGQALFKKWIKDRHSLKTPNLKSEKPSGFRNGIAISD
jgi:hypothetical protein